jgi:acyl CoA:acetate/3-ketoacid CoA transferase alpha subunit
VLVLSGTVTGNGFVPAHAFACIHQVNMHRQRSLHTSWSNNTTVKSAQILTSVQQYRFMPHAHLMVALPAASFALPQG